ncbi:TPA: hypothetical protein NG650_004198 [Vibrio parahaemolyticus]|jgi:hypothetical protein|uniref:head decoration protein n=1 Tax=Vibrio TaxID=662 RepID=UPI0015595127|nr:MULTISPECIES: head decoration protein [Vibrio]MCF9536187.1 hypothetical protein [Vibrio parahaemolyticus]MCF9614189.1 hypothetical protein [Vibrio parahaemolyticus]MCQ6434771.1 head decoration protein [Vibrio parahaemolyticus]MCQ6443976.1 head decoration protein [Vibrio parahaemolyticus]MCR9529246.1 head decoration protein [Vibrio alginolyticus]
MTTENLDYSEVITGDTDIEHVTITIASGEDVAQYTPLVHDETSGHYKAAVDATKKAQFLSSFAVDATTGAKKHTAIKAITIDPAVVAYPAGMTDELKSGLFAGTPISTQSPA